MEEERSKKMKNFFDEVNGMHIGDEELDRIMKKLNLSAEERMKRIAKYRKVMEGRKKQQPAAKLDK